MAVKKFVDYGGRLEPRRYEKMMELDETMCDLSIDAVHEGNSMLETGPHASERYTLRTSRNKCVTFERSANFTRILRKLSAQFCGRRMGSGTKITVKGGEVVDIEDIPRFDFDIQLDIGWEGGV